MPRETAKPLWRLAGAVFLLTALALLVVAPSPYGPEAKKRPKKKQKRPNIVLVMTDDQTADSVRYMPQLQRLLASQGTTFTNSFVSYSLCCPSRATWLTGQYAHNHGVRTNLPPSGGYSKIAPSLGNSLPVWLQRSGYHTGHIGKFLNGYGTTSPDTEIPPGWSEWYGALDDPDAFTGGTYTMHGYTLNENGNVVHYGGTPDAVDPATYQTDVYSQKAADFIRRRSPGRKPFFLSIAPLAPHGEALDACACAGNNPRAAPRHEGAFAGEPLPKPPSYDEADVSDKPQEFRDLAPIDAAAEEQITARYRARLESLLTVDEMVGNLVAALQQKRELRNTVIIFTSDNGFFHGEHRIRIGKLRLFDPSVRVPLIIRGPGVPKGKRRDQPVANIDLAPTIRAFARAKGGRPEDGRSLRPLIEDKLLYWGRGIGLESFFNADPEEDPEAAESIYQGVRTDRYRLTRHPTGELELYDLRSDPFELQSRHGDPAYDSAKASLERLLASLAGCVGGACRERPALKLRLSFRGGRCVSSAVRVRLTGAGRGDLSSARFFVRGKKKGGDGRAPFARKIGPDALSGSRKSAIVALATTIDGRVASVRAAAPRRC